MLAATGRWRAEARVFPDNRGRAANAAVTVRAEVVSGNGVVVSGAEAVTNASGQAHFTGLTLGVVSGRVGTLTLRFSAPGLDPATATIGLRCAVIPIQIAKTVSRALTGRGLGRRPGQA